MIEYIANCFYIPDCEVVVNREEPIHLTKSKLKNLIHILDLISHKARCPLLDLVPDELGHELLRALEGGQSVDRDSSSEDEEET